MLVEMGFLVFGNVAAKDTVDLVVGMPRNSELRVAGIRIKTSSIGKDGKKWAFKQTESAHFIERPNFFYIFCLKTDNPLRPIFIVVSSADLARLMPSIRSSDGNYNFTISRRQVDVNAKRTRGRNWKDYVGDHNFKRIKDALEKQ